MTLAGIQSRAQETLIFPSENLHCDDSVLVYTPGKAFANQKNMPTVFLLHGADGCYRDWSNHMDLQALSDETGFRIICPDGFAASWYVNNVDPEKYQWKNFFWDELWPFCQKRYALDASNTFITGLSMGGHGAMTLYFDHPEYFRGAGSMSGVLDLSCSSQAKTTLPLIFGAKTIQDEECVKEYGTTRLSDYVNTYPEMAAQKMLVITCGAQDKSFIPAADSFTQKCRDLGVRHISMISPGKHSWTYWVWAVRYHLNWFKEEL